MNRLSTIKHIWFSSIYRSLSFREFTNRLAANGQVGPDNILLPLNAVIVVGMAAAWLVYLTVGQRLIEAAYYGPWVTFLHKAMMMEGKDILPLERYFQGADRLLRSATFAGAGGVCASILALKCPSRIAIPTMGFGFGLFGLSASGLAFFYPLEIETRESTVWLHVLAMRAGVNIYDHSHVAFINQNHGPFDPLFKTAISAAFPFLEAWNVTRLAVLVLHLGFVVAAWRLLRQSGAGSATDALYLGAMGYLMLVISAKEFLFVGRSDATAALLLLPLTYLSFTLAPERPASGTLQGLLWGALGISVVLTNWRTVPAVFALLAFGLWIMRARRRASLSTLAGYSAGVAGAAAVVFALIFYRYFDLDPSLYYKHFFGVYSAASGHGHGTYAHASGPWFLGSLLNPSASPDNLKGGPLLLAFAIYLAIPQKGSAQNRGWFFLGIIIFAACTVAYYLNFYGGGQWYYIPFLVVWWFFLGANYTAISRTRLSVVGVVTAALLVMTYNTTVAPSVQRASRLVDAYAFQRKVRELQRENSVLSEDMFFYRNLYGGERIDMGDMVSKIRKRGTGYFGEVFNRTVNAHFERLRRDPPDYIVVGFAESPELRRLLAEKYAQVGAGPGNLTANGVASTRLFQRVGLNALLTADVYRDGSSRNTVSMSQ